MDFIENMAGLEVAGCSGVINLQESLKLIHISHVKLFKTLAFNFHLGLIIPTSQKDKLRFVMRTCLTQGHTEFISKPGLDHRSPDFTVIYSQLKCLCPWADI